MTTQNENKTTITVRSIYTPKERERIREELKTRMEELSVGMPRFHSEIMKQVGANNKRIQKFDGKVGIHKDQLSVKNLYHFFEGRRSDDARVQILDAYLQTLANEGRTVQ